MEAPHENEVSGVIVDACFHVHNALGPGLFESVYEEVLAYELEKRGLSFERQVALPVVYEAVRQELGFRADLIVEGKVIVEIKSVDGLAPVHFKQVLTYLKLSGLKVGLLVNFNEDLIKNGKRRFVNRL